MYTQYQNYVYIIVIVPQHTIYFKIFLSVTVLYEDLFFIKKSI